MASGQDSNVHLLDQLLKDSLTSSEYWLDVAGAVADDDRLRN